MSDLLLPRTDAGVVAQVIAAPVVYLGAILATRRLPEVRRFIVGLATITAAFFALRTVH